MIRNNSGVDFGYYKKPTVLRRIDRRMAINQMARHEDYLEFLRDNKPEQQSLFQDLLIKVTSFFRDADVFAELEKTVFPQLMEGRSEENSLRIWVVGCATGEEVYSLAITLFDTLNEIPQNRNQSARIQIFASDLSEEAIKKARYGVYTKTELQPVTEDRLQRYFTRTDGSYKVVKSIRDSIVFTVHNFLKDPPFGNVDLISCRNVFIYLDPFLQKKALSTFHYSLRENGFLVMGKSETTGKPTDLFAAFSKNARIYSRKSGSGRSIPTTTARKAYTMIAADTEKISPKVSQTDFRKSAENVLVSDYTPASVIVDEHFEIVHINGNIEPFVGPSSGRPTHELMKRARKELAFELRNALHKVKESHKKTVKNGIPVKIGEDQFSVDLEIVPLTDTVEPHYLILFWQRTPDRSFFNKFWKKLR
ncbi:MAG: protein-glutamate O-methyltransferase CheR, partial [Pricia sp.]